MGDLPGSLTRRLESLTRDVQRTDRVPGLAAGLVRDGRLAWSLGVGSADPDTGAAPDADTAYAIGSISKTFTAVLVMQLRDEGALTLSSSLGELLPDAGPHGGLTVRELLAHASGLQRELPGDSWDTLEIPDVPGMIALLGRAEQVLPARLRWHYSNLAFALLGAVVARLDGRSWAESLQARLLAPLEMSRTSLHPAAPTAVGLYVEPFTDQVRREPWPDMQAFGAAGGLWSTLGDLARWASFLCDGADGVLAASTVEEMTRPEIMSDLDGWTRAWGLGLCLYRSGDRVLVGHGGAMPGFLAGLAVRRTGRTAGIVLANTSTTIDAPGLAVRLATTALDELPWAEPAWTSGPPVPPELAPLVGRWWSEGSPFAFSVRAGRLEARVEDAPAALAPSVFLAEGPDRYRTESGREQGELLIVERSGDGSVRRMTWAGYPFTRDPQTFGA